MTSFCLALALIAEIVTRKKNVGVEVYGLFGMTGFIDAYIVYTVVNSKLILALAGGS